MCALLRSVRWSGGSASSVRVSTLVTWATESSTSLAHSSGQVCACCIDFEEEELLSVSQKKSGADNINPVAPKPDLCVS
mgnify:CR=1 FL=1